MDQSAQVGLLRVGRAGFVLLRRAKGLGVEGKDGVHKICNVIFFRKQEAQ